MGFVKSFQEIMANLKTTADFMTRKCSVSFGKPNWRFVARLLPPPLKPAEYPMAMAFVANYPRTNFDVTTGKPLIF